MWCHLVKVTEVTAGLAESNGILLPGDWHKFTCWLTACTPAGSAPGATSMGELYLFTWLSSVLLASVCKSI